MAGPTAKVLSAFSTLVISMIALSSIRVTQVEGRKRDDEFCAFGESVDITSAEKNDFGFVTDDGLLFPLNSTSMRDGRLRGCIRDVKPWIAICPPKNGSTSVAEGFVDYSAIPGVYSTNLTLIVEEQTSPSIGKRFYILVRTLPCDRSHAYYLEPEKYEEDDEFYLLENGSIFMPRSAPPFSPFRHSNSYCFDRLGNYSIYHPLVCSPVGTSDKQGTDVLGSTKYIGGLVAIPFLMTTVIVYSILPELQNVYGKTLRCYLCSVIIHYATSAAARLPASVDSNAGTLCLFLGFMKYSSFVASCFWLNVMCFDIWRTFGNSGSFRSNSASHNPRKFIGYVIYVFGTTSLATAMCLFMEFYPDIPKSMIRPGFRVSSCWFQTKGVEALYIWGPVSPTIVCNLSMFVSTMFKLFKQQRDMESHFNSGESNRHNDNKQWINLSLKFFVVMGITRPTGMIGWFWENPKYLWFIIDVVNMVESIMIFVIFVCKPNIWASLKELRRN